MTLRPQRILLDVACKDVLESSYNICRRHRLRSMWKGAARKAVLFAYDKLTLYPMTGRALSDILEVGISWIDAGGCIRVTRCAELCQDGRRRIATEARAQSVCSIPSPVRRLSRDWHAYSNCATVLRHTKSL